MTDDSLSADELFQLNLMLWLLWSSNRAGIKPILREEGFKLQAIGPTITPTLQVRAIARENGIPINTQACPDLLLRHDDGLLFLPVECKLNSFGPESTTAQQANVLLTAYGSHLAETIGFPYSDRWNTYLIYVLNGNFALMCDTLQELTQRLNEAGIVAVESGTICIDIDEDGVFLQSVPSNTSPVSVLKDVNPRRLRIMKLEAGEDPRPFYLLPVDPSITLDNPYGLFLLEERIRVAVMTVFGSRLDEAEFRVTEDEFMQEVLEVWEYWKDSRARSGLLSRAVRPYLNRIFSEMRKCGAEVTPIQRTVQFSKITPKIAQKIRAYLISQAFRNGDIQLRQNLNQLSFSDLDESW